MNQHAKRLVSRASAAAGALGIGAALTVASLLAPNLPIANAFPAGGQVQSRAIYMGSSAPGATTNYTVTFKPASTTAIQGVILDFCAESPIVGDASCTSPDATATTPTFSVGGATPSVTYADLSTTTNGDPINTTGLPSASGSWTATGLNATGSLHRTLKLTNPNGSGALSTATTYSFNVNNVVNPAPKVLTPASGTPNPNASPYTFYARIITYTSDTTDISTYAPGNEDDGTGGNAALDYGGFALSTANQITITAKVQETLSFCVTKNDLGAGSNVCGDATATALTNVPDLVIGHGTTIKTIDNGAVDTTPAYMQVSTNATTGAVIRMHSTNTCPEGGLSVNGGTACSIPGIGSVGAGPTTAKSITAGTAAYGLFVGDGYTTTGLTTSTGVITPSTTYNNQVDENTTTANGAGLKFGMDNTSGSGVTGTYGSVLASTGGPCNTMNSNLVFAATASLTTPAGIYKTNESLIATGTF